MRTPYSYCETCRVPYFYPLPTCTRCGGRVLLRDPREHTLVGMTTVHLPSNEHPKVPYHILRLQDEYGVTHLRKTMRQYEVGQQLTRAPFQSSPETVLVAKVRYDLERTLLALLEDFQIAPFEPGARMVIHLALAPRPVGSDFLMHLLTFLFSRGITLPQLTFVARLPEGTSSVRFLQKSDYSPLIPLEQFVDLTVASHETLSYGDALYDVPRPLISSDWLLPLSTVGLSSSSPNAPISSALAELFPGGAGLRTQRALDLSPTSTKVLPRRLHLVDGRGETGLPTSAKPLLLAGQSALALDRTLCSIYRVTPDEAVRHTALTVIGEELEAL